MRQDGDVEVRGPATELAAAALGRKFGTSIMVLYPDPQCLAWAREVCDRVPGLIGPEAARSTWWKIGDLNSPAVLAGAVSTAMRADVIVVSLYAAEVPPLPFCIWVDAWLPHRPRVAGVLLALVARAGRPVSNSDRVREYLRVVARQARLDFLIEERMMAATPFTRRAAPQACSVG